ncbi:Glycoside hydrolase, 38 vacuolar alpha mannosidase, partial [Dimargaris verticillata]
FYERVEANSPDLVTWKGELYFELHRGTYTSQSEVKHANRRSEFLLREVEAVASLAAVRSPANYTYPQEEINRLWELVLLNQFHDVLPGSSIEMVYQDAHKFYKQVETQATQLLSYALQVLHGVDPTGAPASLAEFGPHQSGQGDAAPTVLTFNSLPWPRTAVVEVPLDVFPDQVQQVASSGQVGYTLAQNVPSFGPLMLTPNQVADIVPVSAYATKDGQYVLENLYVVATFDRGGRLVSLVDRKVERELIPKGVSGNLFRLYEDIPIYWDAWDVEVYHLEKGRDCPPGTVRVSEEGPLLGALEVTYQLSPNSKCTQIISLSAASPRLDFACDVDWHENRRILKVEFTVDILSDVATYETQFGWVQRPTHYNTTWDMAKFEVCGHKFADLSEFGYGVALLNDSKYGYSTYKNTMRLSLLRAPKAPDAHCDMGRHQFRYALYPHQGTFFESDVVQQGYEFNVPLLQHVAAAGLVKPNGDGGGKDSALPSTFFEWVGDRNIILDTVKKAEDSDALILRFYEAYGGQGRGHLRTPLKIAQAHVCNLLEDEQRALVWDAEKGLALTLKPFQILTLKVGVKA